MKPLTVILQLSTPVAQPVRRPPHPVHLDALLVALLAAKSKKAFAPHFRDDYDPGQDPYAPGSEKRLVPLAVRGKNSPVYQSSVALFDGAAETAFTFMKKPYSIDCHLLEPPPEKGSKEKTKPYDPMPGSGHKRGFAETAVCRSAHTAHFHCVGDKERIAGLLKDLAGLGPLRRMGLGEVVRFGVKEETLEPEWEPFWGLLVPDNGVLMPARELPVSDFPRELFDGTWVKGFAAVRPPYWLPHNRELCWLPRAS